MHSNPRRTDRQSTTQHVQDMQHLNVPGCACFRNALSLLHGPFQPMHLIGSPLPQRTYNRHRQISCCFVCPPTNDAVNSSPPSPRGPLGMAKAPCPGTVWRPRPVVGFLHGLQPPCTFPTRVRGQYRYAPQGRVSVSGTDPAGEEFCRHDRLNTCEATQIIIRACPGPACPSRRRRAEGISTRTLAAGKSSKF